MATSKLLKPTNVTISIPEFTDQPDQRVNSNCIDKEADAINSLSEQIGSLKFIHVSVNGNTSKTVTIANTTRVLIYTSGGAVNSMTMYSVSSNSAGTMYIKEFISGSNITVTSSATNSFTITNSGSGQAHAYIFLCDGSVTV